MFFILKLHPHSQDFVYIKNCNNIEPHYVFTHWSRDFNKVVLLVSPQQTIDFYRLVIQGVDLGGAAGGLTGSGTVEIRVLDINDNIPTLEQPEV